MDAGSRLCVLNKKGRNHVLGHIFGFNLKKVEFVVQLERLAIVQDRLTKADKPCVMTKDGRKQVISAREHYLVAVGKQQFIVLENGAKQNLPLAPLHCHVSESAAWRRSGKIIFCLCSIQIQLAAHKATSSPNFCFPTCRKQRANHGQVVLQCLILLKVCTGSEQEEGRLLFTATKDTVRFISVTVDASPWKPRRVKLLVSSTAHRLLFF